MKLKKAFSKIAMKSLIMFAMVMCTISREGICFFIYHENNFPDELRKY